MCNSKPYPPPSPPVVEDTGESGGLHFEGVHQVSLVLSSGAVIAIIALISVWCMLRKRRSCCKMDGGDNTAVQIAMPTAPLTTTTTPSAPLPTPMATLSPSLYVNQGPGMDAPPRPAEKQTAPPRPAPPREKQALPRPAPQN